MRKHFRVGDRVSVHNLGLARVLSQVKPDEEVITKGTVIWTTRRSRHGLCIVVLVDLPHGEVIESFTEDGIRGPRDKSYITLGWPEVPE